MDHRCRVCGLSIPAFQCTINNTQDTTTNYDCKISKRCGQYVICTARSDCKGAWPILLYIATSTINSIGHTIYQNNSCLYSSLGALNNNFAASKYGNC